MATRRGEVLLSSEFGLYPKKRGTYKVSLTRSTVTYSPQLDTESANELKIVQLSDVIGCRCQRSPGCVSAFVTIFAYPFKKKVFSSKSTRKRLPVIFEVKSSSSFDENLQIAEKWRNVINCLSRGIALDSSDLDSCSPEAPGRLLILINPHSGPGKALQIFNNDVKPMLEEAEIPYRMQVTEYAGHARDLLAAMELSEWYAVVIVSGDGLIYEVINGLMERPDWEEAIRKPVGCLPGGSGNALCCSINYLAGEPVEVNPVLHSTFILIKHNVLPMDLVLVQTQKQRVFSFLSVNWGIMADVDYESEKFRSIGEARFTLGALKRILNLRSYKGKVSFLPVAEYKPRGVGGEKQPAVLTKIRRFSLQSQSNSKSTLSSGSNDQLSLDLDVESMSLPQSHSSLAEEFQNNESQTQTQVNGDFSHNNNSETASGTHNKMADSNGHIEKEMTSNSGDNSTVPKSDLHWRRSTITAAGSREDIEIETETATAKKSENHYLSTPLLPPLDQPVPEDWVVIDDSFISVALQYQTHLNSDMLAAPEAHLSDGFMYLMLIRDGISRNNLLNLFLSFAEAGHVDSPHVEIVKVLAFRIEPEATAGNLMVDGERVDFGPIQGQILPKLSRIMAIK